MPYLVLLLGKEAKEREEMRVPVSPSRVCPQWLKNLTPGPPPKISNISQQHHPWDQIFNTSNVQTIANYQRELFSYDSQETDIDTINPLVLSNFLFYVYSFMWV
jgi:hypothetical protein